MILSSISGIILEKAIATYRVIAIYQPVVNGVGGNLVGIYSSRLSTSLHRSSSMGKWASWAPKTLCSYFYDAFFGKTS